MNDEKDKRREERVKAKVEASMVVVSGKDETIKSSPQKVKVRNISPLGANVESPSVRPGGLHIMYNDLMLHKNIVELHIDVEGEETIKISGKVIWYDRPEGKTDYIIGIEFNDSVALSRIFEEER